METQHYDPQADIDQLNEFLRDELSAVETYEQCLEKISQPAFTADLRDLQQSHRKRADLLSHKISELGGTPRSDSGMWGSFAKLIEGGAKLFGEKSAISALEEGEDFGKENYRTKTAELTPANKEFINTAIAPEHERTHNRLEHLKSLMN